MGCEASLQNDEKKSGQPKTPAHVINWPPKPTNQKLDEDASLKKEQEFINESLEEHNKYRKYHGVPPLEHSLCLTEHARAWAEELAKRDMLMHSNRSLSDGETVGESIYCSWSGGLDVKAVTVVRCWYKESEYYDFDRGDFSTKTGQFTQMVWKDTKEMGIARARSSDGSVYTVANYRPTGNVNGLFKENVLPVRAHDGQEDIVNDEDSSSDSSNFDFDRYAELFSRDKEDRAKIKEIRQEAEERESSR